MIEVFKLDQMINGWFIGNFNPSLALTNDVEVAIKRYKSGDYEEKHYHKIATEYTVILNDRVLVFGTPSLNVTEDILKVLNK